jgi:ABC-type bacteriocin/lantibiotic exporter with double-glycine peptidase domain
MVMTPCQRRFTVFAAICTVALVAFIAYVAVMGGVEWWMALIFILAAILALSFRYGYWMMVLEERDRKKAAKKSGQIPI